MNRRTTLLILGYAALFIFFTFLFLLVNYPSQRLTEQVNQYILKASEGSLSVTGAHFRFPRSLELEGVTLKAGEGRVLELGRALVRLRLLALLGGKEGADVRLDNPWLASDLRVTSSGESWDLAVKSAEIDLAELPEEFMSLPLELKGKVALSMNLFSTDPAAGLSAGEINLSSGPLEAAGDLLEALNFSPLRITRTTAVATIKDNVLTLGETSVEGDLAASARGTVKISPGDYGAACWKWEK